MSSNANHEPINLAERRASRGARTQATTLTPEQRRAYRQLAIAALGLDLPTLTKEVRERRLQRMAEFGVLPQSDRAA